MRRAADVIAGDAAVVMQPPPLPELSVVVPAYRCDDDVTHSIDALVTALEATAVSWEMHVVVDGDAASHQRLLQCRGDRVHIHGYARNRGKGFALRYGMLRSRGEIVAFIDSDGEIDPVDVGRMYALLKLSDSDVVIGSKRHPLSSVTYPPLRRLQSLAYQLIVRALFRINVRDTQTGLKMMRREVALRVLDVALVKRFAFDVELLVLARHFGYSRIVEAPVTIRHRFRSTTNLRAVISVLWDTAAIFYRLRVRRWYSHPEARGLMAVRAAESDLIAEG
jgi:glycosyltransferase involved in cell wall biosynthesis